MNVKKEVYDKCVAMVEKELWEGQRKLNTNRREINRLAKEQRILKAQTAVLHEMLKTLKK